MSVSVMECHLPATDEQLDKLWEIFKAELRSPSRNFRRVDAEYVLEDPEKLRKAFRDFISWQAGHRDF